MKKINLNVYIYIYIYNNNNNNNNNKKLQLLKNKKRQNLSPFDCGCHSNVNHTIHVNELVDLEDHHQTNYNFY